MATHQAGAGDRARPGTGTWVATGIVGGIVAGIVMVMVAMVWMALVGEASGSL